MAEALGRSRRTLERWKQKCPAEDPPPRGRPPLAVELRQADQEVVREVLEHIGWGSGVPTIHQALEGALSHDRIRVAKRALMAARRCRLREVRQELRVSTSVHLRDAMWCIDATHLGRDLEARAVQAEVLRDVGSGVTLGASLGFAATAAEVCATLERAVQSRGGAPLVLVHDNGPGYAAQRTRSWCAERGVLQLFSLPRTPQHNAIAERGMRDLKEDSGLGRELVRDPRGDPEHPRKISCHYPNPRAMMLTAAGATGHFVRYKRASVEIDERSHEAETQGIDDPVVRHLKPLVHLEQASTIQLTFPFLFLLVETVKHSLSSFIG